jgi:hypothetical protein
MDTTTLLIIIILVILLFGGGVGAAVVTARDCGCNAPGGRVRYKGHRAAGCV